MEIVFRGTISIYDGLSLKLLRVKSFVAACNPKSNYNDDSLEGQELVLANE